MQVMAEGCSNQVPEKPVSSVKHDWYQTETAVVITVLIKNVQQDNLKINFLDRKVELSVHQPDLDVDREFHLAHAIVPDQCSYRLSPFKIEIKLKKLEGIRWAKLEGQPEEVVPKSIPLETPQLTGPPPYPTSMKGKDWSRIEKDLKEEEANEKPAGDEALNKLFQEIYGKGSDEVKMAMNKSYMESGGTVLSTNWKDVAKEKVEVKPPDGMEFKKWQ